MLLSIYEDKFSQTDQKGVRIGQILPSQTDDETNSLCMFQ